MADRVAIEERIQELLRDILSNSAGDLVIDIGAGLRNAGVSSASMIALLVLIEREFGFEWDDDSPPEVFHSIATLAAHVESNVAKERNDF